MSESLLATPPESVQLARLESEAKDDSITVHSYTDYPEVDADALRLPRAGEGACFGSVPAGPALARYNPARLAFVHLIY